MKKLVISFLLLCGLYAEPVPLDKPSSDEELIRQLLSEKLDHRVFAFADVVAATSGKKVIPLDDKNAAHQRIRKAIDAALVAAMAELSVESSPVRKLRRINEASHFFEDIILKKINATEGMKCAIPLTRNGVAQRSGYPDLQITDIASGVVVYLDPKLLEASSVRSTLRTFYFEPKGETLKINHDAIHLLCGIEHDGKQGAWKFTKYHLVDLHTLKVRLKAEFQASNAELYK